VTPTPPPEPEPFIALPSEAEVRAAREAAGGPRSPYDFGFVGDMSRLLSAHPRIGPAMQRAFAEIMFAPGALTRAEREMVAAVASAAQDCEY
jgi:alkylhydroperoxidase/carboxymuconolactone decarboxylase family protein YurZ